MTITEMRTVKFSDGVLGLELKIKHRHVDDMIIKWEYWHDGMRIPSDMWEGDSDGRMIGVSTVHEIDISDVAMILSKVLTKTVSKISALAKASKND